MFEAGSLQPSGRVITGGRLLLAFLFLLAVWSDSSQPARLPAETYAILMVYVAWALGLTLLTWRDWWLDARLAVVAHVIDVAVFLAMLYSTEGYTSPYFTFFVFLLLSAAIRWGWRETAATALVVIAAYFATGLLMAPAIEFDTERFIVRTGHLLILSAILIWFGANQRIAWPLRSRFPARGVIRGGDPLLTALDAGMRSLGAQEIGIIWRGSDLEEATFAWVTKGDVARSPVSEETASAKCRVPTLYNLEKCRMLEWGAHGRWKFRRDISPFASLKELSEGLAIPIRSGMGSGIAFFQGIPGLSTDHLEVAFGVGSDIVAQLQTAEALSAAEERSMAKARVAVARDLHDSIVQFLSGIGFRIEALARRLREGSEVGHGLEELKQLVIGEQVHLRAFIGALRTGGSLSTKDMERDIAVLCQRMASQWDIECRCHAEFDDGLLPMRLHLDVIHLIREAVANAVRHGNAGQVNIAIRIEDERLALSIENDGAGIATGETPASLESRVGEAGGMMKVHCEAARTSLYIELPIGVEG